MKRFATALLFVLALASPARPSWGPGQACPPGAVAPRASQGEYAGLKPGDVAIPRSMRVHNDSGSQCCWVSLTTIAHLLRLRQLYDLPQDHKHASNDREMTAVLRSRGVTYRELHTEAELRAALAYGLPVAIFIPGHCCVLVGLDDGGARVISNNHRECEIQVWSKAQFDRLWGKWGVVLYPRPGEVERPGTAPSQGYGPHGGVWVQIGPRYQPAYPPAVVPAVPAYPYPAPWYAPGYVPAYPYYPRPGINIRVNPRPYHYHQHQHYHQHHRGPHGGGVELTAEARHTIANCTVEVGQGSAGGSGTFIAYDAEGKRALVASAAHVFRDLGPARVRARGMGETRARKARVVYLKKDTDVAMLEVEAETEPVCTALADEEPEPGRRVYKLGYPAYAQYDEAQGIKGLNIRTGVVKPHNGGFLFESSCYVQSGDSGGGIFLEDGSLCSIITGFYGPQGRLDPTCMMGSGVTALHTAVRRLNEEGHGWAGKLRDRRKQRRQDRHQRRHKGEGAEVVPAADRALLPWNAHERHQSQRRRPKSEDDVTLPAPKWKQPAPPAVQAPPAPPPCPNPNCPCPPGKCPCPPPCPCPPRQAPAPEVPEVNEPSPPAQQTAFGVGVLTVLLAKLALLIASRRKKA